MKEGQLLVFYLHTYSGEHGCGLGLFMTLTQLSFCLVSLILSALGEAFSDECCCDADQYK